MSGQPGRSGLGRFQLAGPWTWELSCVTSPAGDGMTSYLPGPVTSPVPGGDEMTTYIECP